MQHKRQYNFHHKLPPCSPHADTSNLHHSNFTTRVHGSSLHIILDASPQCFWGTGASAPDSFLEPLVKNLYPPKIRVPHPASDTNTNWREALSVAVPQIILFYVWLQLHTAPAEAKESRGVRTIASSTSSVTLITLGSSVASQLHDLWRDPTRHYYPTQSRSHTDHVAISSSSYKVPVHETDPLRS
jgi:hypothetical protein